LAAKYTGEALWKQQKHLERSTECVKRRIEILASVRYNTDQFLRSVRDQIQIEAEKRYLDILIGSPVSKELRTPVGLRRLHPELQPEMELARISLDDLVADYKYTSIERLKELQSSFKLRDEGARAEKAVALPKIEQAFDEIGLYFSSEDVVEAPDKIRSYI